MRRVVTAEVIDECRYFALKLDVERFYDIQPTVTRLTGDNPVYVRIVVHADAKRSVGVDVFIGTSIESREVIFIAKFIDQILDFGALERYFRPEGKMKDSVVALPTLRSKLRLYGLRLSDKILILGNGGEKNTRTYDEDDNLRGYVLTLQRFEELLREGVKDGSIVITESEIQTDKTFDV